MKRKSIPLNDYLRLSPEARRVVRTVNLTFVRVPARVWAGVLISDKVPTEGRRVFSPTAIDEELYARLEMEP